MSKLIFYLPIFLSLTQGILPHKSSTSMTFVASSNSLTKSQRLLSQDSSTAFCDSNKDIRIVLLGQAWIQFPDTNLSYPGVNEFIQYVRNLNPTVLVSNLETSINGTYAQENNATIANPTLTHIAPPEVIDILQSNYSIDILTTSNNHNSDFGPEGTISGILELEKRKMKFTGSGYNDTQAITPTYLSHINGKSIGIMGVVSASPLNKTGWIANATYPGVNAMELIDNNTTPDPVTEARNLAMMTTICQKSNLVIMYHHNHYFNDTWNVSEWWKNFAHSTIDAGGSIYLSQGAQNIRGIEVYKGNLIIYSNGNLFFQGTVDEPVMNQEGYIVDTCYDGVTTQLKGARVIPTILTNGTGVWPNISWNQTHGLPTLSDRDQAYSTLLELQNLSSVFGTTIIINETEMIGYIQLSNTPVIPPDVSLQCRRTDDLKSSSGNDSIILPIILGVGGGVIFLIVLACLYTRCTSRKSKMEPLDQQIQVNDGQTALLTREY